MEMGWGGEEVWDMEHSEGGWGGAGNGIWSVKNELKIKLNLKKCDKPGKVITTNCKIYLVFIELINEKHVTEI